MLTKIKGQNFRVFTGGELEAVPEATSCSVTVAANMEDSSTKDSESGFSQEVMVSKSWNLQVQHVDASAATLKKLLSRMLAMQPVDVGFDQTETTAGTQNRTPAGAPFARTGEAYLTDLSIVANNRETIQITEQYTGNGELSTSPIPTNETSSQDEGD